MPTVAPGSTVAITADTMGARPKWLEWTAQGSAGGTVELPSGHRRLVRLNGTTRASEDYFVTPETLGSTDGAWRATIYAPNGSHIFADGLRGFPTIGTPTVRLQADAPARAIIETPRTRSADGILSPDFSGWSDGHTEPVGRGMEVTVEYRRPDGNMALVFRGMIYQVQSGETVTLTAYDRLMDLYQYSDQYQSHQGYREEALGLASVTANEYIYTASEAPGAIVTAAVKSDIAISAEADLSDTFNNTVSYDYSWILCSMPTYGGVAPQIGDIIKSVGIPYYLYGASENPGRFAARVALFRIVDNTVYRLTDWTSYQTITTGTSDLSGVMTFSVSWTMQYSPAECFVGITQSTNQRGYMKASATQVATSATILHKDVTGQQLPSTPLSNWTVGPLNNGWANRYVAPNIYFEHTDQIAPSSVGVSGTSILVPKNTVTTPSNTYATTPRPAYQLNTSYQVYNGTSINAVVSELIRAAGLNPDIVAGALLGRTTYYTSSTFDYLTCVQELIHGGNFGIRAAIEEPGKIEVRPRDTIDGTPVASFSTAPGGSAQHCITSHNITAHWMAEKATQAILAENATATGLPLAIETDDALMDGSLCRELQSPLRGITADSSIGTHILLAMAAGGKMVQLHTNVYEGELTLAGYHSEIWNLAGDHAGGKPVAIEVPEYGAQGNAVPTMVEFGGGVTRISLDNIRTADRSEVARSMGLTGDAISNTARALPNTAYIFARYDDYITQTQGIALGTVTKVEFLKNGGAVAATQTDAAYIKTAEDTAGYAHICTVLPASSTGYAAAEPIVAVRFTMDGVVRTAVLDNDKYALGRQALHADIRFRKA